jgi:hypothetical protein
VSVIAWLSVATSLDGMFRYHRPLPLAVANMILVVARVASAVAFTFTIGQLCERSGLRDAARSWRMTSCLLVGGNAIPATALQAVCLFAIAVGSRFHFDLGIAGVVLIPIFAAPVVHMFASISRLERQVTRLALVA